MSDNAIYLANSRDIVGYPVKIVKKPRMCIIGYTIVINPGDDGAVPLFVGNLVKKGYIDILRENAVGEKRVLGLGSWDEKCPQGGMRYTMCIEKHDNIVLPENTDGYQVFETCYEATEWMCFELTQQEFDSGKIWLDDPYKMIPKLGYRFHLKVGVHFDVDPSEAYKKEDDAMEFWISVARETKKCKACICRKGCESIQRFQSM
jgi:hypothetical protein